MLGLKFPAYLRTEYFTDLSGPAHRLEVIALVADMDSC